MSSESKGYGGVDGPPALTVRKPLKTTRRDWVKEAECRKPEHEEADFFGNMGDAGYVASCKEICRRCPVFLDCLQFAKDNEIGFGIWGGRTPSERVGMGWNGGGRHEG